jgi:hypothetical protein
MREEGLTEENSRWGQGDGEALFVVAAAGAQGLARISA